MVFFGLNIKYLRELKNLSQKAFGELFEVERATVSLWETKGTSPTLDKINAIAMYFKVNVGVLISENLEEYEKKQQTVSDNLSENEISKLSIHEQAIRYNKIGSAKYLDETENTVNDLTQILRLNAIAMEKFSAIINSVSQIDKVERLNNILRVENKKSAIMQLQIKNQQDKILELEKKLKEATTTI